MNEASKPLLLESGIRWLWIALAVIVFDQVTKLVVVNTLQLGESVNVLPVFDIFRTYNLGAAWSMFADAGGAQRWVLSAIALVASVFLLIWLRRIRVAVQPLLAVGLALILGGAIGNLIDRVRLGHVIDFLLVYWNTSRFPAFNVADAAITIGAGLVIVDAILEDRRERLASRGGTPDVPAK